MAYRFHGRASVDPSSPRAFAICDYCGFTYNHYQLRWTQQWAGPVLQNTRFLVCSKCWDIPQPQLKPRILPPDPMPTMNARPPNYLAIDFDYQTAQDGSITVTQDDTPMVGQNVANNREDG